MTKQEFLDELKSCLTDQVSAEVMMDSYRYYFTYIDDEIRKGRAEADVLEELGKPYLIARSIIAAQIGERVADEVYTDEGITRHRKRQDYSAKSDYKKEAHKEFSFDFHAWYAKILYAAIITLLVFIVFFLIHSVFWIFIRFGIPILIIMGIFYLIMVFTKKF